MKEKDYNKLIEDVQENSLFDEGEYKIERYNGKAWTHFAKMLVFTNNQVGSVLHEMRNLRKNGYGCYVDEIDNSLCIIVLAKRDSVTRVIDRKGQ